MRCTKSLLHRIHYGRRLSLSCSGSRCFSVIRCFQGGSRFRDQSVFLVGNGALDVADRMAPPHDLSFRFELRLPHRAKEIDFQFHGSKGFIWGESTCKRYTIAASAMSQRIPPCSVPMGFACCGPAAKTTVARPSAMSFASNPISRAMGTSFVF